MRKETCCHHIGYSFRLTARVLLYAPSYRQDSTYTSSVTLAGTRNSSMGPPHEGSIRRPIAPWANALTIKEHVWLFVSAPLKPQVVITIWFTANQIPLRNVTLLYAADSFCRRTKTKLSSVKRAGSSVHWSYTMTSESSSTSMWQFCSSSSRMCTWRQQNIFNISWIFNFNLHCKCYVM